MFTLGQYNFITEALSPSQFPVFTMYASKICIKNVKKECSFPQHQLATKVKRRTPNASVAPRKAGDTNDAHERSWSFDRVYQHQLVGFVRKRLRVKSGREECMKLCLFEEKFICR